MQNNVITATTEDFKFRKLNEQKLHMPELAKENLDLEKVKTFLVAEGIDVDEQSIIVTTEEALIEANLPIESVAWCSAITKNIFIIPKFDQLSNEALLVHEAVHASSWRSEMEFQKVDGTTNKHDLLSSELGLLKLEKPNILLSTGTFLEEGIANYYQRKYIHTYLPDYYSTEHRSMNEFAEGFTRLAESFDNNPNSKIFGKSFIDLVKSARNSQEGFGVLRDAVSTVFNPDLFDVLMMMCADYYRDNDEGTMFTYQIADLKHYLRLLDRGDAEKANAFFKEMYKAISEGGTPDK